MLDHGRIYAGGMSMHPQTSSLHFIRHAPVVKRSGHVPPADPPIVDGAFNLSPLTDQLPEQAIWHVSPLQRTMQTAELLMKSRHPLRMSLAAELSKWTMVTGMTCRWRKCGTKSRTVNFTTGRFCPPAMYARR